MNRDSVQSGMETSEAESYDDDVYLHTQEATEQALYIFT